MKIYISTDMEGVSGVSSWSEMESGQRGSLCSDLLRKELSWIIEEIDSYSADESITLEEICICDSHSRGENLEYGSLAHKSVTYVKGYPRSFYMMEGLDETFDVVFLIGYHARIGSFRGMMDHSYSSSAIYEVRLDGNPVGEVEINAYLSGVYGVPIGLVSGDDILEKQLREDGFISFPYIRTKEGLGRFAGKMYSLETLETQFREKTRDALRGYSSCDILRFNGDMGLEVDLVSTVIADAVSIVPGVKRVSGRTIKYVSKDFRDIYRMILTIAMLGGKFAQYH